jgi:aryl-alcohol dehydrogenase-like predicted oxidoreductase
MPESLRPNMSRRDFLRTTACGALAAAALGSARAEDAPPDTGKIPSYNENMEYRQLGTTDMWVSAVCLGGHWKRLDTAAGTQWDLPPEEARAAFLNSRSDVVSACLDHGINYVDACSSGEILAYAKVLKGRRDKMYFGFSWYERELRFPEWCTKEKLIQGFDDGLKESGLDYVDIWRCTGLMTEPQPDADVEALIEAFDVIHQQGKARYLGISSHHHGFLKRAVETWPQLSVVLFPYTANSKELPQESLFEAIRAQKTGVFGIKPFASNSIFTGDSQLGSPTAQQDDELARLTLRYILANDAITAPIPGLINTHQVENVALAVRERRELDLAEQARLRQLAGEMHERLPEDYAWLREWEWV